MITQFRLQTTYQDGHSLIEDCFFTSPLKVGTPRSNGNRLDIVLMMASAGVLKGDMFDYEIVCQTNSCVHLTEQSYTKIFDTGEGAAQKHLAIRLEKGASLYYHPCAVIPFGGSSFDSDTKVVLSEDSEFAYADIVTAGRVGMGEQFAFRHYRNRVCVSVNDKPVWLDHCLLEPEHTMLQSMIFFDEYTHQGTFYYYGSEDKQKRLAGFETKKSVYYGVSAALRGICVRILAHTAQDIEEIFAEIAELLELDT